MIYKRRVDNNQKKIVNALKKVGASIIDLSKVGQGVADLLVGHQNKTYLIEIKNPENSYGKKGFNQNQKELIKKWNGSKIQIADSEEKAFEIIGI